MSAAPVSLVLSSLAGVRPSGGKGFVALCPAHEDRNPSLSLTIGEDGRVLLPIRARYLIFGKDIRLWLRPVPVVRVYMEGRESADFYQHLDRLRLVEREGVVGVDLGSELQQALFEGVKR